MAQNVLSEQTVLNSSVGRESAQNRDEGAKLKVEISSLLISELTLFFSRHGLRQFIDYSLHFNPINFQICLRPIFLLY